VWARSRCAQSFFRCGHSVPVLPRPRGQKIQRNTFHHNLWLLWHSDFTKFHYGRGSARTPLAGMLTTLPHDPQTPIVGWGGGYPFPILHRCRPVAFCVEAWCLRLEDITDRARTSYCRKETLGPGGSAPWCPAHLNH